MVIYISKNVNGFNDPCTAVIVEKNNWHRKVLYALFNIKKNYHIFGRQYLKNWVLESQDPKTLMDAKYL